MASPVLVTYSAPRRPAVVASVVGGSRPASAHRVDSAPVDAPLDAAELRQAADAIVAARPRHDFSSLSTRPADGPTLSSADIKGPSRIAQAARLISILPVVALAFACACSVASLAGKGYDRLAHHLLERHPNKWTAGTLRDAHNVWARFLIWLSRHDVEHDGAAYDAVDVGDFVEEVDRQARAKGEANRARAAAKDAAAAARAAAVGAPPPPPARYQDGAEAANGVKKSLGFIARNFGISIPLDRCGVGRAPGSRPRMPTPAFTPEMVFRLCEYVVSPTRDLYFGAVAAALLFCCFSCNRCEQANECSFQSVRGGMLHGVLLLDKHPNPDKRRPRPFWMRIEGPVGGSGWFLFLLSVLAGVEDGCFVFRDFDSPSGDPAVATRFMNNPLTGARLLHAIRCTLVVVCRMSPADAARFALHSSRHVLMEVAGARGEQPLRAVEIGRWSGSTAQDEDLTPSQRLDRRHQVRMGIMPESYAPMAKVSRVCSILCDQMSALDALYRASRAGSVSLGLFAGFGALASWPAAQEGG